MNIREANIKDAENIASIVVQSWKRAYKKIIPDEYLDNLSVDKRVEYIKATIEDGVKTYLVAEVENQIIGMICFYPYTNEGIAMDEWELEAIYIHPNHWNKSIGHSLFNKMIEYMKLDNGYFCGLWVIEDNIVARNFYEKIGFKEVNKKKTINILDKEIVEVRYLLDILDLIVDQPDYIYIEETLRLAKHNGDYGFSLEWYKDMETIRLIDDTSNQAYDIEQVQRMYTYLSKKGELYFIEVKEDNNFIPIGDVTFWKDDMPIVIGDKRYRNKGIGYKIIKALIHRGQELGYKELYIGEIYDFNTSSQKAFEKAGFKKHEKTDEGYSYKLVLE